MSKTKSAKPRPISIHSRAARRATSPSLQGNVDKSLKDVQPPSRNKSTTHMFSGARNAGIAKKKNKQLKRGQLERQRRGAERADIVREQLDVKLVKSLDRLKTVKTRRKDWELINAAAEVDVEGGAVGGKSMFSVLDEAVDDAGDEDKEASVGEDQVMVLELPVRTVAPVVEQENPITAKQQDEDVVT